MADDVESTIDLLSEEWSALIELAADFTDTDWSTRTDLPAWDVKDCYAHVAGTECVIQGKPVPEVDLAGLDLSAPSALFTEPPVASRRHLSGPEVLGEVVTVTKERLDELHGLTPDEWDQVGPTPLGEMSYREFMCVRVFDCWMHEQDVRRALGRPGHQEGAVVDLALSRSARAIGFVIGKKVAPPDGTVVEIELTGPMARTLTVAVSAGRASVAVSAGRASVAVSAGRASVAVAAGRASVATERAGGPTARLTMDQETFWCLGGGRWYPENVLTGAQVVLNGDQALGAAIVRALCFMI